MRRIKQFRPSAALVLAFIALFVAMSGVGYTAAKLNGKRLKTRSVSGSKLKNDTITGTQVNEATLQIVGLRCAGGTTYVAGVCLEKTARPAANDATAVTTCQGVGGWLPGKDQLQAARAKLTLTNPGEWTNFTDGNGVTILRATIDANGVDAGVNNNDSRPFRCAKATA